MQRDASSRLRTSLLRWMGPAGAFFSSAGARWARVSRHPDAQDVVGPFLLQRATLFAAASFASQLLPLPRSWIALPELPLLSIWVRWDATYYLLISSLGYGPSPWGNPNLFFPLFPGMMRLLRPLMPLPLAGLLISNLAALGAVWLLYRLTAQAYDRQRARLVVWLVLLFPTSFFLSALYAESTFMVCALATFWCWQQRRWGWAAVGVALGALAKPVGAVALTVPFAVGWLVRGRRRADIPWFVLSAGIATGVLMAVHTLAHGSPFGFLGLAVDAAGEGGASFGGRMFPSRAPFWEVMWDEGLGPNLMRRLLNFSALTLGAAACVALLRAKRWEEATFVFVGLGVPLAIHGSVFDAASMARYLLVCFPIYGVMAGWLQHRPGWERGVITAMAILQAMLAILFTSSLWAE